MWGGKFHFTLRPSGAIFHKFRKKIISHSVVHRIFHYHGQKHCPSSSLSGWRTQKGTHLFSTKFAFGKWNSLTVKYLLKRMWNIRFANVRRQISFHIATLRSNISQISQENYFTFGGTPNISLPWAKTLSLKFTIRVAHPKGYPSFFNEICLRQVK